MPNHSKRMTLSTGTKRRNRSPPRLTPHECDTHAEECGFHHLPIHTNNRFRRKVIMERPPLGVVIIGYFANPLPKSLRSPHQRYHVSRPMPNQWAKSLRRTSAHSSRSRNVYEGRARVGRPKPRRWCALRSGRLQLPASGSFTAKSLPTQNVFLTRAAGARLARRRIHLMEQQPRATSKAKWSLPTSGQGIILRHPLSDS